jgi:hypothetical protein
MANQVTRYRFAPTQINSLEDMARYVNDNMRRISDALLNLEEPLVPSYTSQPDNPQEGSLAIADGTGWNPGSGAGTYIYRAGQWRRID